MDNYEFENYARTITCRPRHFFQPSTEAEVVKIVQDVSRSHGTLRVFGAGHSWSELVPTQDTLLNLDLLRNIVSIDPQKRQVTVQAGIRIKNLVTELVKSGLAMENLGAIMEQSLAGAIATSTHGTGLRLKSLPAQVIGMKLVTGQGKVLQISETDTKLLSAARVGLGALGVVTEITLQCVPSYNVKLKAWSAPFEEVLDNLPALVRGNERVRLYWISDADKIYVNTMNQTDEPVSLQSPIIPWFRNVFLRHYVLTALVDAGNDLPDLIDVINKFQASAGFERVNDVGLYYDELTTTMPPRHIECEYALPLEKAAEAVRINRDMVRKNGFKVNLPGEVRFTKSDDSMLSMAHGRDTCFIGAYTGDMEFARPYYAKFEPAMKALGGRPHWGKFFTLTQSEARQMYPQFDAFNEIRRELDPDGIFSNKLIRDLFD